MGRAKLELTSAHLRKIEELASSGLGVREIAGHFGMSKATLDRRLKENIEASEALERGRSVSDSSVLAAAFEMARSGKYPTMTMFWLRSRCGWGEEKTLEPIEVRLAYSLDKVV